MDFFDSLDPILKAFWFIAIPASVIFIIQTILTFSGSDSHDSSLSGLEHPYDPADGTVQVFSLRNMINFLLGFSWGGISLYHVIGNTFVLITIALLFGLSFVYLFFFIVRQLLKLSEDNSFRISEALGKNADVYLTIPQHMSGKGKVLVSVNGAVHELEAMTEEKEIRSGSVVKVVRYENQNIVIVETI